jgi:hypothetical protein
MARALVRFGGLGVGLAVGIGAVSMMLPPKVSRSTIAAHSRGSVNVLVHEPKLLLEAMATLFFSSRS